jgi:hypothetical protein
MTMDSASECVCVCGPIFEREAREEDCMVCTVYT